MKRVQVAEFSTSNWRNHVGAVRRVNIYIYGALYYTHFIAAGFAMSPPLAGAVEAVLLEALGPALGDSHDRAKVEARGRGRARGHHQRQYPQHPRSARHLSLYAAAAGYLTTDIYIIHWRRRQRSSSPRALSHFLSRTANTHWSTLVV